MSQKSALQRRREKRKQLADGKPEITDEVFEEELTGAEAMLESIQPHLPTIGLVAVAAILAIIALVVYRSAQYTTEAIKWVDLNQAKAINAATGDIKDLSRVADEYADTQAGLIGSMYTADSQLRSGITQLANDRQGGLGLVRKAKENYEIVVNADANAKTDWLDQRSQFQLAYANETLGEFKSAQQGYTKFLEDYPESPLAERAERGLKRSSNDDYVAMYKTFKEFEDTIGEAPGPLGSDPSKPNVDLLNQFEGVDPGLGQTPPSTSPLDKKDEPKKEEMSEPAKKDEAGDAKDVEAKKGETKPDETAEPEKETAEPEKETAETEKETAEPAKEAKEAEKEKGAKEAETEKEAGEPAKETAEIEKESTEAEKPAEKESTEQSESTGEGESAESESGEGGNG